MAAIISKEEPLQLKQGSKVFSRLFSRESSAAAPSFRVYYGVASAGSVPFLWESQPGTPKNDAISTSALPPLTPPPSYYSAAKPTHHKAISATAAGKKQSKAGGIFSAILPKIILHRRSRPSSSTPSPSSCSSSSSSSSSWSSASFRGALQSPACSSMRSRIHAFSVVGDDDDEQAPPPTCFRVRHESFRAFKGCRVATTVRSALASVGGHGSAAAAAQRV